MCAIVLGHPHQRSAVVSTPMPTSADSKAPRFSRDNHGDSEFAAVRANDGAACAQQCTSRDMTHD